MKTLIVCLDDFAGGQFKIATDIYTKKDLEDCICQYEKPYIKKILGDALGQLFIDDIDNKEPQTQIYKDLFDAFHIQPTCYYEYINWDLYFTKKELYSFGLKKVLLSAIYYHYISESQYIHSTVGTAVNKNEASVVLTFNNNLRIAEKKFNAALESIDAIQTKCFQDTTNYPDFNGQGVKVKHGSII